MGIGDQVAIAATVRRRITEDCVSRLYPRWRLPTSIIDHTKVNRSRQIDLKGEVTRIDEDTVTIDLGPLVWVDREKVRSWCRSIGRQNDERHLQMPRIRTDNIATGYEGRPHDGPVEDESKHFVCCPVCGQTFDARDLGQVFHHAEPQHEPLPVEQ
ncbi:hypothetical protein [Mesorhizobium sp. M0968]|uniref:hypothetical protein n=1 Tax=Mesorhizobium sp. M0968 TaxID=2957037 RepID=UPI003339D609